MDRLNDILKEKLLLIQEFYDSNLRLSKLFHEDKLEVIDKILTNNENIISKIDKLDQEAKKLDIDFNPLDSEVYKSLLEKSLKLYESNKILLSELMGKNQNNLKTYKTRSRVSNAYKQTEKVGALFYDQKK